MPVGHTALQSEVVYFRLLKQREIAPYAWVRPDHERWA
jgi:hypothetical protein